MKSTRLAFIAAALGLGFSASVFAQDLTRAQVEEATLAAARTGQLTRAGQADVSPVVNPAASSQTSRAQVRAQTLAAEKSGWEVAGEEEFVAPVPVASVYSRAEVKAQTLAAARAGLLVPAGEGTPLEIRGYSPARTHAAD